MKQDLEGQKLFHQIVDETPLELKTQLRFSDAKTEAEVSRWLGGTHNFTLKTLALISVALGEDVITVLNQYDLASESCHMAAEEQKPYGK